jgi:hypothetical protein
MELDVSSAARAGGHAPWTTIPSSATPALEPLSSTRSSSRHSPGHRHDSCICPRKPWLLRRDGCICPPTPWPLRRDGRLRPPTPWLLRRDGSIRHRKQWPLLRCAGHRRHRKRWPLLYHTGCSCPRTPWELLLRPRLQCGHRRRCCSQAPPPVPVPVPDSSSPPVNHGELAFSSSAQPNCKETSSV